MKDFFVEKFLSEVIEVVISLTEKEIFELKRKAGELIDALCSEKLLIHDSGTYAMLFIVMPGCVYFDSFFQARSALKMLLLFLKEEDCYLDLPEEELPNRVNYLKMVKEMIQESFRLFSHFFQEDKEEQERILYAIKGSKWMYSKKGVMEQIGGLFETVDEEISYVSGLIQDLKSEKHLKLYFGSEKDIFEADLTSLLAEKSGEKAILKVKTQIQEEFGKSNLWSNVFAPEGFRLFDYLMKNHLSSGRGWKSEISFFFRMMEDGGLLKCDHDAFWDFLADEYPKLEPMGKIKSLYMVDSDARRKIYSSAKKAIGFK